MLPVTLESTRMAHVRQENDSLSIAMSASKQGLQTTLANKWIGSDTVEAHLKIGLCDCLVCLSDII
jgi:hypothetical protein